MDQGSTFGPQETPIPSQEEINKCTPTPPHILHFDPKLLPTCPQAPYVPMPPHVPAPTSPTFTSHVVFSCAALCSYSLWSISSDPPQILPRSSHGPVPPMPLTSLSPTSVPYTCSSSTFLSCSSCSCPSTMWLYKSLMGMGVRRDPTWAKGVLEW